jgi:transposase
MTRTEILRGVVRRRGWSIDQKLEILAEAARPGITVSKVARRHDLHPNQVFKWLRQGRFGELAPEGLVATPGFVPVALPVESVAASLEGDGLPGHFEVQLGNGRVVRFSEAVSPDRLRGLVRALEER